MKGEYRNAQILDEHNDYMTLYRIFNDDAYLEKARQTLQQLKSHV